MYLLVPTLSATVGINVGLAVGLAGTISIR